MVVGPKACGEKAFILKDLTGAQQEKNFSLLPDLRLDQPGSGRAEPTPGGIAGQRGSEESSVC